MKRVRMRVAVAVILAVVLVGCGDMPDITEEQADMVAEYAGGVLLRYSSRYDLRLVARDADEDGVEDSVSAVSGEAAEAEAPEEEEAATPSPTPGEAEQSSAEPEESAEPAPTEEPTVSLDELYGIKGLHFSYHSSMFTDKYPEHHDSLQITPDENQILFVVSFYIKNTTEKTIKVDLTTRPFHYELDVGGEKVLPTISLLPNGGLNYLMTKIKPGKTEEAVLIFNLDKSKEGTKGIELSITEGDKTATVKL